MNKYNNMEYRLDKDSLLSKLSQWNNFLNRKVHFIACGGTAMTLLNIKASTRDIDFIVPNEKEYEYLIKTIQSLGYKNVSGFGWAREDEAFTFDLFPGKRIHTTELLDDPINKDNHVLIKEFSHIYLGVLNDYDLIVSKLFRGSGVDFEDCVHLAQAHKKEIDSKKLKGHFLKLLNYHPVGEERIKGHWESFERKLAETKDNGQ
jgi:hypothetical protein